MKNVVDEILLERQVSVEYRAELKKRIERTASLFPAVGLCLSEEGDLLSQWRAYADNGSGVAIGFRSNRFADRGLPALRRVDYSIASQKAAIAEIVESILALADLGLRAPYVARLPGDAEREVDNPNFPDTPASASSKISDQLAKLIDHFHFQKNPAFREEMEWRAIDVIGPEATLYGSGLKLNFRANGDRIVPYASFDLPLDAISEVVIGPRNITPIRWIQSMLSRNNWIGASLRTSQASYRT